MAEEAPHLRTGQFGPTAQGGHRRQHGALNWRRFGVTLAAVLGLCGLAATATGAALLLYGNNKIDRVEVDGITPVEPGQAAAQAEEAVQIDEVRDVRNILLVGSDSRAGLDREARKKLGTGKFEGTRTDTIILLQLDPLREGAAMLSFPRDLLVTRCDGTQGRINGAFEIGENNGGGGPSCLVETVTDLTGIDINHYAQIDFQGFVDMVDTLGGVRLYLDEPIADDDANIDLPAGCVTLDGRQALGFVRVRKIDDDFGRIARQQRFLREVVAQLTTARIALDVPRLFRLVDAVGEAVNADPSLTLGVMRKLAFSFRDLTADRIDTRTVPAFNRIIGGAAYVVADPEPAEVLFAAFREAVAAPAAVGRRGPADVRIADVPALAVRNGTSRGGLAAVAADALRSRGFAIASIDNADRNDLRRTLIRYPRQRREEARLVAKLFAGARLVRAQPGEPLTVLMGADADVTRLQRVAARPAPAVALEPEPAPTYKGAVPAPNRDC